MFGFVWFWDFAETLHEFNHLLRGDNGDNGDSTKHELISVQQTVGTWTCAFITHDDGD